MNAEQLRTRLLERRKELQEVVDRLYGEVHHRAEPVPQDFSEQATEMEGREVQEALDDDARLELRQIAHALERIEDGSWATCEDCGDEIPPARLEALPHTTRCVKCAQALEARA